MPPVLSPASLAAVVHSQPSLAVVPGMLLLSGVLLAVRALVGLLAFGLLLLVQCAGHVNDF